MSTITCSNFFPKVQLSTYGDGQYMITGHGSFLELYDLDKFLRDDFNAHEYEPIRTHVFETSHVHCYTVFNDTGHVLALASDFHNNKLSIQASLVHRDRLLKGGYTGTSSTHCMIEEPSRKDVYFMSAIPNTNQILLLTERTLTHIRYLFEDDKEVVYEILAKLEIQSHLPPLHINGCIIPLAICDSSEYSTLISADGTIVLLSWKGNRRACRIMSKNEQRIINGTEVAMMIPGKSVAVVGGDYFTLFISTSHRQKGVSKDQLRIIHEKYDDIEVNKTNSTRAITWIDRDGFVHVYVLKEKDLTVWKLNDLGISHERTFVYFTENIGWKFMGKIKRLQLSDRSVQRRENKLINVIVHHFPISAMVLSKNNKYSNRELLIISCESGLVKVLRTDDILKIPLCEFMPLGSKKLPIQILYPCWEYPLSPVTPLTQLIGLSDGIPVSIKLKNESWNVTDIIDSRKVMYTHMKSKVSTGGFTTTVFHNENDICFCFFSGGFMWKEDRLNDQIKDCFINDTIVAVHTDKKLLIVDVLGLFCKNTDESFYNDSIELDSLAVDADTAEGVIPLDITSILVAQSKNEQHVEENICWINFKSRLISDCAATLSTSQLSQDTLLQDVYNRPYSGVVNKTIDKKKGVYTMDMAGNNIGHSFQLFDNGLLIEFLSRQTGEVRVRSANLNSYLPNSAELIGFITIEGTAVGEGIVYVLAKDKDKDVIYLKDGSSYDDMTIEPIPSGFGDYPVFGHFVGDMQHGRCVLYTTSTRKFRDIPELIRVETRVSHARHRESLIFDASLFQPDTVVRLLPRNQCPETKSYNQPMASVMSTYGATIGVGELSGKGTILPIKEIDLMNKDYRPLFISSFDTYFVRSSNTLYILAGTSTGELAMVTWDSKAMAQNNGGRLEEAIREVFFFGKEHATEPPRIIVYINDTELKVVQFDLDQKSRSLLYRIQVRTDGGSRWEIPDHKMFTICNGDNTDIHDIWTITNQNAILHPGRKTEFHIKHSMKFAFSSWEGKVESASLLTTRENETSGNYADFVFVVKEKCRIGILATVQEVGKMPDKILFTELGKTTKSTSIAIHAELLNYSLQNPDQNEFNIRLFIARRKSIKISLLKLAIESGLLKVVKNLKLANICTTITDPSYIVVTASEESQQRASPKYAIISGAEGTETIRICEKKLQARSMKNA